MAVGENRINKRKKSQYVLKGLIVILLCISAFSCFQIIRTYFEYKAGRDLYNSINKAAMLADSTLDENQKYLVVDHEWLTTNNNDYIGWLRIPNTNISYPMVQGTDNDYYLRRSFLRKNLNSGVIFMDFRCDSEFNNDNTIIYGHNMKDGSMFSNIQDYDSQDFWDKNNEIQIYLPDGTINIYKTFAFYIVDVNSNTYLYDFESDLKYLSWQEEMIQRSWYETDLSDIPVSKSITLSTCVNGKENERYILQAVLIDSIKQQ